MRRDRLQLFKFALIFALLVLAWFSLTSVSHDLFLRLVLGWIGLGVVALYYGWLKRDKIRPKKP
jgi:hypothetical protein